jgi:histidinol-phosphate aminotransferase
MKIRLNMNEMYKLPPKEVLSAVKDSISEINRYTPQKEVDLLTEEISNYADVPRKSIHLSSGSDLILKEFIFLFSNKRQIIIAEPTFIVINNSAHNSESNLIKIRLNEPNFRINLDALIEQLDKPSLLVFDNPNNPTGNLIITEKEVENILKYEEVILIIDEAYFEFSKVSYVNLIRNYSNVAVVRTLSKSFGLAGSGIGYLIGGEFVRNKFQGLEIMLPYPSVIAGIKALQNQKYMEDYVKEIDLEKKRISRKVSELNIVSYPSHTNFLLMKSKVQNLSRKLEERGILVHDTTNQLAPEYFRVTIGAPNENNYFLETLEEILKENEN